MYLTPSTVPGMAKVSRAENSNTALPRSSVRANSHAINKPRLAQMEMGAAPPAKVMVLNSEFQAVPVHTSAARWLGVRSSATTSR